MNKLSAVDRDRILHLQREGMSIRAVTRLTGASKNTVAKLLVDAGQTCMAHHDEHIRKVRAKRVQIDEIRSFTYAEEKNVVDDQATPDGVGDTWTWVALNVESKLVLLLHRRRPGRRVRMRRSTKLTKAR